MSIPEDWRFKNECFPFISGEKRCIVVESAHETPGIDKEARLAEARTYGVFKLLKFFGKDTKTSTMDGIDRLAVVEDYLVSYRPCVRMKVLVSVPRREFDQIDDDPEACTIVRPPEGNLSAMLPIGNVSDLIETVTKDMRSFIPYLYKSDKFISNVVIPREIKRLSEAGRAIQRYIDLNNISPVSVEDPECVQPNEVDRIIEIGFDFSYNALFALVDPTGAKEQHTIGYDCLLENKNLNYDTTVHYLINLESMYADLQFRNTSEFDVIGFLTKYTIPTPIIEPKQNALDGLEKYNDGNLSSFANIAKLITLDFDINLCKTAEDKTKEDRDIAALFNAETTKDIDEARKQIKEPVANDNLSTGGVDRLRETIESMSSGEGFAQSGKENLNKLYNDVLGKIDFACVLEETMQCMLENMITRFGQEVFDDPDLEKVFRIQDVNFNGRFGLNCGSTVEKECDGVDFGFRVGLPIFQGIQIPETLPTFDFLADTMDLALKNLYNRLVNVLATTILGILEGLCELILTAPDGLAGIGDQLKDWLSESLGVDLETLTDPEALGRALLDGSGSGFVGIIGKAASRVEGAILDTYSETGIKLNLPNKETGQVEEVLVSTEFLFNLTKAAEDAATVLTPTEYQNVLKGNASNETYQLAYKCVTRNGNEVFPSQQDFEDTMTEIGNLINPQFLTSDLEDLKTVANDYCELADTLNSQNIIRATLLSEKDSTLPSEEIEEIFNKEKERRKKKLLNTLEMFEMFQNGLLAPAFPNIFGRDGLIPETPPVIDEISQLVVAGSLGSVITNFNIEFRGQDLSKESAYARIYEDILPEWNIFDASQENSGYEVSTKSNKSKRPYVLGYTPSEEIKEEVREVSNTVELGPYTFGGDIDVTGINGLYVKSDGPATFSAAGNMRKNKGESNDDDLFEDLVRDLEPYVSNSTHTFDNDWFGDWKDDDKAYPNGVGKSSKTKISGARAYAFLLILQADQWHENNRDKGKESWKNPFWDDAFEGQDPQRFQLKIVLDNRDDKKNTNEVTIKIKEYTEPVVTEERNTLNLVEVDVGNPALLATTSLYVEQDVEENRIGNERGFFGRKIATGRLREERYKYDPVMVSTIFTLPTISTFSNQTFGTRTLAEIYNDLNEKTESLLGDERDAAIRGYMYNFAGHVNGNSNYSLASQQQNFDNIDLQYPNTDILQFNELRDTAKSLVNEILGKTLSGEYCDTIGATRRVNSISCVKMLIRLYITELALVSIQVFDVFDRRFMESDFFTAAIYNRIWRDMDAYTNAFVDTLEGNLFDEIQNTVSKYWEISDISIEDYTESEKFKALILDEIKTIMSSLETGLNLQSQNYENWNEYIAGKIVPEVTIHYDDFLASIEENLGATREQAETVIRNSLQNIEPTTNDLMPVSPVTPGPYVFLKSVRGDIYSYELIYVGKPTNQAGNRPSNWENPALITKQCIQPNIAEGIESDPADYTVTHGPYDFGKKVNYKDSWSHRKDNDHDLVIDIAYETGLDYSTSVPEIAQWLREKAKKEEDLKWIDKQNGNSYTKQFNFKRNGLDVEVTATGNFSWTRTISVKTYNYGYSAIGGPLLTYTKESTDEEAKISLVLTIFDRGALESNEQSIISLREEKIWANLKNQLLETDDFKFIFNNLMPIRTMIASLSTYGYAALSDSAIFSKVVDGVNLFDLLTNTKLSTLQIFAASIYGGGKISYEDPFLQKAGTDQV